MSRRKRNNLCNRETLFYFYLFGDLVTQDERCPQAAIYECFEVTLMTPSRLFSLTKGCVEI